MKRQHHKLALLLTLFLTTSVLADDTTTKSVHANSLQKFMFYRSFVQDDPSCAVSIKKGMPVFQGATASSKKKK